jgi:hypothetical protein
MKHLEEIVRLNRLATHGGEPGVLEEIQYDAQVEADQKHADELYEMKRAIEQAEIEGRAYSLWPSEDNSG